MFLRLYHYNPAFDKSTKAWLATITNWVKNPKNEWGPDSCLPPSPFGAAKTEQNNNCRYLIPTSTLPAPLQCAPQYFEICIYHAVLLCNGSDGHLPPTLRSNPTVLNNPRFPNPQIYYQFLQNPVATSNIPHFHREGSRYGATSISNASATTRMSAGAKTPPDLLECLHKGEITSDPCNRSYQFPFTLLYSPPISYNEIYQYP